MAEDVLTPGSLARLYGKRLFLHPADYPVLFGRAAVPAARAAIGWRTKPSARLTIVLSAEELANQELTSLLRNIVQAIGIPFDAVAFGKLAGPVGLQDFDTMPTAYGVLFGKQWLSTPANPAATQDKHIYIIPGLAEMAGSQGLKREAWNTLKQLKAVLFEQ